MITREQWRAAPPRYAGNKISDKPLGVVIHYEGPPMGLYSHDQCVGKVLGIQRFHQDARKWSDIAYNFLVCQHGYVFEGRGLTVGSGANGTTSSNYNYYAVCAMIGDGDGVSDALLNGIKEAVAICRGKAGNKILGHRDCVTTACPGDVLYAHVRKGTFDTLVVKVVKKVAAAIRRAGPPPTLHQGSVGAPVKALQAGLNRTFPSYSKLAVDGVYGPSTRAVIKEFQSRLHLTVDGVVGPKTRSALKVYGITF